jgi:hypothetical protein
MESEVQEATSVPRSELDAAFSLSRCSGWMVVQSMSAETWGYELYPVSGARLFGVQPVMVLPEDW